MVRCAQLLMIGQNYDLTIIAKSDKYCTMHLAKTLTKTKTTYNVNNHILKLHSKFPIPFPTLYSYHTDLFQQEFKASIFITPRDICFWTPTNSGDSHFPNLIPLRSQQIWNGKKKKKTKKNEVVVIPTGL